jgi:aryl-alcohol dehydrogenase-like predicted oxidoreductase
VIALRVLEAGLLTDRPPSAGAARPAGEATAAQRDSLAEWLGDEPLSEIALRFALSRPEMTAALIGFSSVAQVDAAAASAAKGPLPAPLLARVEAWRARMLGLERGSSAAEQR